ncbi:MAG: GntR family transcriptional regulator [Verrucomicrobia bacterium]|nr:GntR family transcriptional regulator [Verrucomicrobiota bacterium]
MTQRTSATARSESALRALRRDILAFKLPAGALLAEAAVARALKVSRVPVREALFALEREGLVEFSETGRAYVRTLRPEDFEELFVLRLALEPAGARLASPRLRKDSRQLETNIAATRLARSPKELTQLDLDFHEAILVASGNRRLARLWKSLRYELELWLAMLRAHQQHAKRAHAVTVASHEEILRCLREQSPAAAERLMRQHILSWREWLAAAEPEVTLPSLSNKKTKQGERS